MASPTSTSGTVPAAAPPDESTAGASSRGRACPFLDTINRAVLDFDMAKRCSVTLTPNHVYACLVCGKFFEGRGKHTHAYTHSVQELHHVFINLHDGRVWCLPDLYEVLDASLKDIQFALHPSFPPACLASLSTSTTLRTDVSGTAYLPGYVGLNNLNSTDGISAVVHALAHVHPLRDALLQGAVSSSVSSASVSSGSPLLAAFTALVKRVWSPAAFKATVAPVDFIHAVTVASGGRYSVGTPVDVVDFTSWLLNTLHSDLTRDSDADRAVSAAVSATARMTHAGVKRRRVEASNLKRSVVTDVFQGEVLVDVLSSELSGSSSALHPFLYLSLDLPPAPLFKSTDGAVVALQVPIYSLLAKYNGVAVSEALRGQYLERRVYNLKRLPQYLICAVKRFKSNSFFTEKNSGIVTFPVRNLDLSCTLPPVDALPGMTEPQLRTLATRLGVAAPPASDLLPALTAAVSGIAASGSSGFKYDLIANIVHDSPPDVSGTARSGAMDALKHGSYHVQLLHEGTGKWYDIADLTVTEAQPQVISVTETSLLIYRRVDAPPPAAAAAASSS